jgi:lysophospholipase L1-like esterase
MGEDANNRWNQELGALSRIISQVSDLFTGVKYLDLRENIYPQLNDKKTSAYLPTSLTRIGLDTILLKGKEQIDKKSYERGLIFTLDGVHLNSRGAELVADIFLETIQALEHK